MQIGIDTSVIIGLLDSRDIWHIPAVSLQEAITAAELEPVYFDCALAEAMSTIVRRLREKGREAELAGLLDRLLADFPCLSSFSPAPFPLVTPLSLAPALFCPSAPCLPFPFPSPVIQWV